MDDISKSDRVQIYFKKSSNAPILERSFNFCGDCTFICKNDRIQHAEICFLNDKTTYLATIERHVDKMNRQYNLLEDEGYWIGFEFRLPYSEITNMRNYCEECNSYYEYDLNSLYCICFPALAAAFKKVKTHSCASLCFNTLLKSKIFYDILIEMGYSDSDILGLSNQANPNVLYEILKQILKNPKYSHFISKIKMNYIFNIEEQDYLVNHPKYINSSDSFFEF